ncbi:MAG: hypothetical protein GWN00_00595, partial [Aliifodinibius sp.]|nr:hypothetical protein [Candidatus Dadabacteria bacterium]NIT54779.1 hypothetical protein [Fodinibius sp.]NIV09824.1 hypothetical protein [Fodinibius sp.]NIY23363.1 hypothetical protein [Fodinibius sp.]
VDPDPSIYQSASPFPLDNILKYVSLGFREYNYVSIAIVPFQYIPLNRQLYLFTDVPVTVDYQTNSPQGEGRMRAYSEVDKMAFEFMQGIVKNSVDLNNFYPD